MQLKEHSLLASCISVKANTAIGTSWPQVWKETVCVRLLMAEKLSFKTTFPIKLGVGGEAATKAVKRVTVGAVCWMHWGLSALSRRRLLST